MNAFLWFFSLYQPVTKNWIQNKQSNVFAVISIWIVFFSFGIKMTLNNVCWHLVFRIWCLVTGRSNEKNVSYQIFFRNKPAVDPNLVHYFWCHFRYLLWSEFDDDSILPSPCLLYQAIALPTYLPETYSYLKKKGNKNW